MDEKFCNEVISSILTHIDNGKKNFVLWGFNPNSIHILSRIEQLGLSSFVSGIIEDDKKKQGGKIFQWEVMKPEEIVNLNLDVLVIAKNRKKEDVLNKFIKLDKRIPDVVFKGVKHLEFSDDGFYNVKTSCLVKSYANGYENTLIHMFQSIKYLADNNIQGHVAEFGIFKGGTIAFIAKTLKHFGYGDETRVYGFDAFDGFPPRASTLDLYSNVKCEFKDFEAVERYCSDFGINVIKGDICETHKELNNIKLMLSFFDTDNYSPTRVALETCFEQTVRGGIFVFDHYATEERFIDTIGERMAAKEVFKDKNVFHLHGTGIFMKL